MIAIVNYGSGNIQAIANIYNRLNVPLEIASGMTRPYGSGYIDGITSIRAVCTRCVSLS